MSVPDPIDRLSAALEGRYRIERELGEGGMATVYLADDLKHERKVALKVLKPELAAVVGAERFLAEIKTTANLQHPHILPLHDSGEADGLLFYVMPYVQGESLRERLKREHQLPVDDAVRIATNMAEALDYAHGQGVIHRDIKPANILLQAGKPVIADFGIALAVGAAGAGRLTETGLSLGTPHYMSPEQATGDQNIGPATDIYALGCVLYEMLVGEPPFTGSTPQAVLGKIITGDRSSATKQRATVPSNVDAAIAKALEKVPADRFAGAGNFAEALAEKAFRHRDPAEAHATSREGPWKGVSLGLAAVAAVLAIVLVRGSRAADPPPRVVRASVRIPNEHLLTAARYFEFSPDGSSLVYQAPGPAGPIQLWIRPIDGLESIPIAGSEGLRADATADATVSPDGKTVVFWKDRNLYLVPKAGGRPTTLVEDVEGTTAWSPDGQWIYFGDSSGGISRIRATGGPIESVTRPEGERAHIFPHTLPGGRVVLFQAERGEPTRVMAVDVESREVTTITDGRSPRYVDGYLLFTDQAGTTLNAAPFDPDLLELTGASTPIVEGLKAPSQGHSAYTISPSGDLVYAPRPLEQMAWVTREGATMSVDATWSPDFFALWSLSPDGSRLAYRDASGDLQVKELDDGPVRRITSDGTNVRPIGWVAEDSLLYVSGGDVWVTGVGGAGDPRLIFDHPRAIRAASISPAGRWLAFETVSGGAISNPGRDLYALELGVDPEARLIEETPGYYASMPAISPDGRWLAFLANEGEGDEFRVFVRPFPDQDGRRIPVSLGPGSVGLEWSPDGELFYIDRERQMMAARLSAGTPTRVTRQALFTVGPEVPLGSLMTTMQIDPTGRFMMRRLDQEIVIVVNWLEEVKARLNN